MHPTDDVIEFLKEQIKDLTFSYSVKESYDFLDLIYLFGHTYTSGCELNGRVYLVLDNSLIQDFKHRDAGGVRAIRAAAYTVFCSFVKDWSMREALLAITPAAIFEHVGRKSLHTYEETAEALADLRRILTPTRMPITPIEFNSVSDLRTRLSDVEADVNYLTNLLQEIDRSNWETDLKSKFGVKIPLRVAADSLPKHMPLRYFVPFYVSFVLSGRIERHMSGQTQDTQEVPFIHSGPLVKDFAILNSYRKRQKNYGGFGDIDIFQTCDLSRQFQEKNNYVLIGQTTDELLNRILRRRTSFCLSSKIVIGAPDQEARIRESIDLIFGHRFSEYEERGNQVRHSFKEFFLTVLNSCSELNDLKSASKQ